MFYKLLVLAPSFHSSFLSQLDLLVNEFNKNGVKTYVIPNDTPKDEVIKQYNKIKPDAVLLYTFFSLNNIPPFRHSKLYGFEVSDTDRLGDGVIQKINDLEFDGIITPSRWSASGFHDVDTKVHIIPHAINPKLEQARIVYNIFDNDYNTFWIYAPHSKERKGLDIVEQTLPHVLNYNAIARVSQFYYNEMIKHGIYAYPLTDEFDDLSYYSYMARCSHFFYPVRGGAFEIPVLEALALGMNVAIPEEGAWTDIPLDHNDVVWIKINGRKRYWFGNHIHVGNFINIEINDALEALFKLLDFNTRIDKYKYREYYSVDNVAKMYIDTMFKS